MIPHQPEHGKRRTVFRLHLAVFRESSMSQSRRKQDVAKLPSPNGKGRADQSPSLRDDKLQVKARQGRPSYDDYAKRVCQVLRWTPFQLETCTALAQLPGVRRRIRERPTAMLPLGTALRALLDEAVHDVEEVAAASEDRTSQRLTTFLRVWYRERGTVVQVAETLGLSRTHVAHQIQRPVIALVARRFLDLAWQAQMSA
jgi:hypothetical protein